MRFVVSLMMGLLLPGVAWADDGNPSFNLVNRGAEPIMEVYATPAGVPRWGQDRLARFMVPPGKVFPVRLPGDGRCLYDIRVVYASGRPEERRRLNTCDVDAVAFPGGRAGGNAGDGAAPPASRQAADDPTFRLVNRGDADVNELYVSPSGNDRWGRDRLGDDVVAAGQAQVIRMPRGGCSYDVRVVFADGAAVERRTVNLCTITDLRVP